MKAKTKKAMIRQERCISALKTTKTNLKQMRESAAWYVLHPNGCNVRLKLMCRDVSNMVNKGVISVKTPSDIFGRRLEK